MAITKKGDLTYVFGFDGSGTGIATSLGMKPMELKTQGAAEYVAKAEDEEGQVFAMVTAADARTFTLTGYITNQTTFEDAEDFTFDGKFYIITGRNIDFSSKEFMKGEVTGEQYDAIVATGA